MNKKILSCPFLALFLLSYESSFASYSINMPLEVPQGGALPYNTIIMGGNSSQPTNPTNPTGPTQPTEPVFDVPDPLPTESDVVCEYNITTSLSAYVETQFKDNNVLTKYSEAYYRGQSIINYFKGKEMKRVEGDGDQTQTAVYYEVCVKGEPLYSNQDNNIPDQEWDQDDCRYDIDFYGREYAWNMLPTSDGRLAFTGAYLGSFGNVTTNTSGIVFPEGTITVPEGKILPDNNQRIIMGNVAFNKGNFKGTRNTGNDTFESNYAVCKKTAK